MEKSIEKFLSEGKILGGKKVDGLLIEDVNLNLKASNLPNGKYILYRGTGWVLESDGSLIKTATANPGVTLFIEESITKIQEKTYTKGM